MTGTARPSSFDYNTSAPTATVQYQALHVQEQQRFRHRPALPLDALIQDCVFDGPNTSNTIYDPFFRSATTKDHNYFSQTLTGQQLTAGSPAINGAHDGTDAGAVPYP